MAWVRTKQHGWSGGRGKPEGEASGGRGHSPGARLRAHVELRGADAAARLPAAHDDLRGGRCVKGECKVVAVWGEVGRVGVWVRVHQLPSEGGADLETARPEAAAVAPALRAFQARRGVVVCDRCAVVLCRCDAEEDQGAPHQMPMRGGAQEGRLIASSAAPD